MGLVSFSCDQIVPYRDIVISVDANPARNLIPAFTRANVENCAKRPSDFPYVENGIIGDFGDAEL